nr:trypsin beta-like [Lepeophtheirus salmonis]
MITAHSNTTLKKKRVEQDNSLKKSCKDNSNAHDTTNEENKICLLICFALVHYFRLLKLVALVRQYIDGCACDPKFLDFNDGAQSSGDGALATTRKLGQHRGCTPNSNRIANGVAVEKGEIPWQVSMIVGYKGTTRSGLCGGSIISTNNILTAAHCFNSTTIGGYKTTPRGVINDLAIVTIKNEFEFESTIQPICLPLLKSSIPRIGSSIIASGWGLTNYTHTKSPPNLLRTNLQVYSFDNTCCLRGIPSHAPENSIMCVHNPSSCTCNGDSGGPLTMEVDGICILVGVTSQGFQCGELGYGSLHTNVSTFLPWILNNIIVSYLL